MPRNPSYTGTAPLIQAGISGATGRYLSPVMIPGEEEQPPASVIPDARNVPLDPAANISGILSSLGVVPFAPQTQAAMPAPVPIPAASPSRAVPTTGVPFPLGGPYGQIDPAPWQEEAMPPAPVPRWNEIPYEQDTPYITNYPTAPTMPGGRAVPRFDDHQVNENTRNVSKWASILPLFMALGGDVQGALQTGAGLYGGIRRGAVAAGEHNLDRAQEVYQSETANDRAAFSGALSAYNNKVDSIDKQNTNIGRSNADKTRRYDTQVRVAQAAEESAGRQELTRAQLDAITADRAEKNRLTKERQDAQAADKLRESNRKDAAKKLDRVKVLLNNKLPLTPEGEAYAAKVLNELAEGSVDNLPADFLRDMSPEARQKLQNATLDRQQRLTIARESQSGQNERNQARLAVSKARDQWNQTFRESGGSRLASSKGRNSQYLSYYRQLNGEANSLNSSINQLNRMRDNTLKDARSLRTKKQFIDKNSPTGTGLTEEGERQLIALQKTADDYENKIEQKEKEHEAKRAALDRLRPQVEAELAPVAPVIQESSYRSSSSSGGSGSGGSGGYRPLLPQTGMRWSPIPQTPVTPARSANTKPLAIPGAPGYSIVSVKRGK